MLLILRALPLEQAFVQSSPQFTYLSNASMTNRFSDGAKKGLSIFGLPNDYLIRLCQKVGAARRLKIAHRFIGGNSKSKNGSP
jgi:hypothetical protein